MTEKTVYPLAKIDYFYEATQERFLAQVVRAFSGFQYVSYLKGVKTYNIVPCLPDQSDLLVATLIRGGPSEVKLPEVPVISVTHTGLEMRKDDLQCPTLVSTVQVSERKAVNGVYTAEEGRSYRVDRLMPRPFAMTFDVDVWTSNKKQKYQLMEQMLTIFMPDIQIQNSENALDWAAMTTLELVDFTYSSAAGPAGTDGNRVDYFTLKMRIPMWLSAPAIVSQRKRIEQININLFDGGAEDDLIQGTKLTEIFVTPGNHCIGVREDKIYLLSSNAGQHDANGEIFDWAPLVRLYGSLRPGVSTIRLSTTSNSEDTESDIVGTIDYDMSQYNRLIFTLDPTTLPADTLAPIQGVVNPRQHNPGNGLPNAQIGTRYLLQESITGPTIGWGTMSAQANDIVEFDGTNWTVAFRPVLRQDVNLNFVTNQQTGRQLRWGADGWEFTYDHAYRPGFWRLHV